TSCQARSVSSHSIGGMKIPIRREGTGEDRRSLTVQSVSKSGDRDSGVSASSFSVPCFLRHRNARYELAFDALEEFGQGVAGDRDAVVLEADDGARGIGFLTDQVGDGEGQLAGAAGVVD